MKSLAQRIGEYFLPKASKEADVEDELAEFSHTKGHTGPYGSESSDTDLPDHGEDKSAYVTRSKLRNPADELMALQKYTGKKVSRKEWLNEKSGGGHAHSYKAESDSDEEDVGYSIQKGMKVDSDSDKESAPRFRSSDGQNGDDLFSQVKEIEREEKKAWTSGIVLTNSVDNQEKSTHVKNQILPEFDVWSVFVNGVSSFHEDAKALQTCIIHILDMLIKLKTDSIRQLSASNEAFSAQLVSLNKKRKGIDDKDDPSSIWKVLHATDSENYDCILEILEKWWGKMHFNSQDMLHRKFKTINQGIAAQMNYVLNDKDRLIRRTKLSRNKLTMIRCHTPEQKAPHEKSQPDDHLHLHYAEIFDDTDFYQALLRDFVDAKMHYDPNISALGGFGDTKEQKRPGVDPKASKGRRIRYEIHPKLTNFMAPIPLHSEWTDEKMDQLYMSLPRVTI